jgi:AcrR family transcriptional regulator
MGKIPSSTENTRERILTAAAEIMSSRGYARATTRLIAEAAGVNEVTIFRHFGNKRNLLLAMIQRHSALPNLTNIIENRFSGDYRKDLILLATIFFRTITERQEALRLMLCEAQELPDLQKTLVKIPDQLRTLLTRYFEEKMNVKIIRRCNPEILAQGFLGMFFSYGIAREILDSKIAPDIPQEEIIEEFIDIFIEGTVLKPEFPATSAPSDL